ncbi:hypothetical protein KDAU_52500 [Dictyobacter aurantiacus]|uniref:NADH:ubiquinone reductase (non-electrogenic) n=1 Tax=Dictyobacter aurantiacus TaxID=1936993 RepID=A0A401ZM25_9CHLR|nr:FAD-dependent oxidoreductase [Dictyobacter aurantiacus]GCE07921.1 hypothetical protein KDAU_52500 [Dictyobacter aurantiacus]
MQNDTRHSSRARAREQPRVVIVGAGFGGLEAAKALRHAPVQVTVIDRWNHHLFQPMLYQVATAGLSIEDISAPIRRIFHRQANTSALMAEVTGIDGKAQPQPFHYHDKGTLATIGRAFAVVAIGPLRFTGFLAWLTWIAVHIFYLIGFRNRLLVLIQYAWAYVTFQPGARIILPDEHARREKDGMPVEHKRKEATS